MESQKKTGAASEGVQLSPESDAEAKKPQPSEQTVRPKSSSGKPESSSPVESVSPEAVLRFSYEPADSVRTRRQMVKMPLRRLEPGRTKLVTIETKKIISVLDETIVKVELISAFSYIIQNLEFLSTVLGPELIGAFREHLRLSNILEATLSRLEEGGLLQKGTTKGDVFGADDPAGHLPLIVHGLRGSVRNILRLFESNSRACQVIRDIAHAKRISAGQFFKSLSELRAFLFEKLLTTPLEEREKNEFMQEISHRDKKNRELIVILEEEVTAAIQNRDEEMAKKDVIIKDLKTQLHSLAKCSESQIQRTRTEAEDQQKEVLRGSQAKCTKLQQELNQLKAQLNALISENQDVERALRKKKYKVEMEIENWVQKYDIEMLEKQKEIEDIDVYYSVEKEHLAELREKFALLDQEYSQIREERKVKQEQKEKGEKELAILIRAATLIQALWKGYRVRSLLRTRRKRKGRGKKGGFRK